MRRISTIAACTLSVVTAGCAISPERVASSSNNEICKSFGIFRASAIWTSSAESYGAEVRRRNLISAAEWQLINEKSIQVGMSRCAMYAAFGGPDRENSTTSAYGTRVQHVFNSGYRYISPYYIYTENDKVVAWQK